MYTDHLWGKNLLSVLVVIMVLLHFPAKVWPQEDFPNKPIQIIVGTEAGGSDDLRYRSLAPKMAEVLKQPVIVVNKPGAANQLAVTTIAKSKPDGYTIGPASTSALLFMPHMQKVGYNTLSDFTFLAGIASQGYGILVKPDAPWKSFQELVAYSKQNPGKVKYGSWGIGGSGHLYMAMVEKNLGIRWAHVPFKGDAPNLTALVGGHVPLSIATVAFAPYVRTGQLRLLAVIANGRMSAYPDIPTVNEVGVEVEGVWDTIGMCGPKGLPPTVVRKLEGAICAAAEGDEFRKAMKTLETEVRFRDSETYTKMVREVYPQIGDMVKKAGLAQAQ